VTAGMEPGLTEAGYNNKAPGYTALARNSGLFEYVAGVCDLGDGTRPHRGRLQ
jgi:hypothetical protein